jgi:hypothetical protein
MLGSEFAKPSVSHGMEQAKLGRMHDENLRLDRESGRYFRDQWSQMFIHRRCRSNNERAPGEADVFPRGRTGSGGGGFDLRLSLLPSAMCALRAGVGPRAVGFSMLILAIVDL